MSKIISVGLLIFLPLLVAAEVIPPLIGPESPLPPADNSYTYTPTYTDDPIGDVYIAGTTWYDYQHNGSTSRMIGVSTDNNVHIVWMNGMESGATNRHIFYNMFDGLVFTYPNGIQLNSLRSGYTTMDIDGNNPIAWYHSTVGSGNQSVNSYYNGFTWAETFIPQTDSLAWPHGVTDNQGYYHMVAKPNLTDASLYYSRSQNGGATWGTAAEIIAADSMDAVSQTMAASPVSNKVAIVYTHPRSGWMDEDVYYIQSLDGVTWNFSNAVNITNFGQPGHPMTNEVRAWTTVNAIYDYDDNLHIVYPSTPYPTVSDASIIWHWSQATGHTKIVGELEFDAVFVNNDPGAWHSCWDLPCLGIDESGTLYCIWEQCTNPGDESAGGYGNWDVWATYSTDDGETWMASVNLTDTQTPGAPAGQCLSEGWPTLAKHVDSYLHISYIRDKDAGGIPQSEGSWTENPVIYQKVPVNDIMTNLEITLTPYGTPIVIPANGGSFNFDLQINNMSDNTVICDGYTEVELPSGGNYGPIVNRPHIILPGGASVFRSMTQNVPASAPAGNYQYIAGLGDYGWNVWSADSFAFEKLAVNEGGVFVADWDCIGWDSEEEIFNTAISTPESFASISVNPNPFNPETEIAFELTFSGHVRLGLFDVSGREVAVLVDNFENSGNHKIKFNGGNLPSGVYFFSLTTNTSQEVIKTILLK